MCAIHYGGDSGGIKKGKSVMKIGLAADNTKKFPSLPLMKLSAYHKKRGDYIELAKSKMFTKYDLCYVSRTFNLDIPAVPKIAIDYIDADKFIFGGSGYAIEVINGKEIYTKSNDLNLPDEVEHIYPDYSLYPQHKDTSYGFLTRGCPNSCGFCIVAGKEGRCSRKVADLSEWHKNQKTIKLLDPNILACNDREKLIEQLISSGAKIDYTQGLDARFITDDIAKLICKTNVIMVHFAFDLMENEQSICKGLETFAKHFNKSDRFCKVYILTNYNTTFEEDYYRVKKVIELGYSPDVRIYQKQTSPQIVKDLASWANNTIIYRSGCGFENFEPRKGQIIKNIYNLKG